MVIKTQSTIEESINKEAINQALDTPLIKSVAEVADKKEQPAYLVGGYVRDLLLSRSSKDIDVVTIGDGIAFAKEVAELLGSEAQLTVFKKFMTANIQYKAIELEIVGARKESYSHNSRKPEVQAGTLEDDLRRRDLTINALAIGLHKDESGQIRDLFNGIEDLKAGVARTPLDPYSTFVDDPLRMVRTIRFATQLHFNIEPETFQAIGTNCERLSIISQERITDELNKIMQAPVPSMGFKLLQETGVLELIFPELSALQGVETIDDKSHKDNFYHTLKVLDNVAEVSDDLWLRWAALLHDIGKPPTKRFDPEHGWTFHGHEVVGAKMVPKIFKKLRLPLNDKMRYVKKLVRLHLRPIALTDNVTDSAIRRLNYDAGDDIDDLLKLCKADITSKNQRKVNRFLRRFDEVWEKIQQVEEKDWIRNFQPPIKGEEIMETFQLGPCKEVGLIKDAIKEAILNGEIDNNYEEAREYMFKKAREFNLYT